jgi:hypothetical protein
MDRRHNYLIGGQKLNHILAVVVALSLVLYFFLSIYLLPNLYMRAPKPKPVPVIINTNLSPTLIYFGNTVYFSVQAGNIGDNADIEIISIAFPNLTGIDTNVQIQQSDFTQKPLFVKVGDKVGSSYTGLENIVYAKYPSIEAFSRPWHSKVIHNIKLEIKPPSPGKFLIFLKAVSLPNTSDLAHYPQTGIKDFQNEFVKVHELKVLQN